MVRNVLRVWPFFTSAQPLSSGWLAIGLLLAVQTSAMAKEGQFPWQKYAAKEDDWFTTDKAAQVAENLLSYRSVHAIWPKNLDTSDHPYLGDQRLQRGTFDNGASVGEIRYLARIYQATGDKRYRQAVKQALDTVLASQYPNGGWPQSYPPGGDYPRFITFNDDVMVNLLRLVGDVAERDEFDFLKQRRDDCRAALVRGIGCLLKCQIYVNQSPTVWCAQHDEVTLQPRPARAYEPVSLSGAESAGVVLFLMSLENPSPDVITAVNGACRWFQRARIYNLRVEKQKKDTRALIDPAADPLWARFYTIGTNRPIFMGRDGVVRFELAQIERERRAGYTWYGDWGAPVLQAWPLWYEQHLGVPLADGD